MKTHRTRGYYKLSVRNRAPKLAGFLGGALHLLGLLGLRGVGRVALGESKASSAEDERKAEHRGHDLFHGVYLLVDYADDSRPSCNTIMSIGHETSLKVRLK